MFARARFMYPSASSSSPRETRAEAMIGAKLPTQRRPCHGLFDRVLREAYRAVEIADVQVLMSEEVIVEQTEERRAFPLRERQRLLVEGTGLLRLCPKRSVHSASMCTSRHLNELGSSCSRSRICSIRSSASWVRSRSARQIAATLSRAERLMSHASSPAILPMHQSASSISPEAIDAQVESQSMYRSPE